MRCWGELEEPRESSPVSKDGLKSSLGGGTSSSANPSWKGNRCRGAVAVRAWQGTRALGRAPLAALLSAGISQPRR